MVFSVVMYGWESWTIKKVERWRINTFELRCWRRLLRDPWTASRSIQSILEETNPEYSLEGLKLKFQYFGHLIGRANSLEMTLMLRKIEGKWRRRQQRMSWFDSITDSVDMNVSKLWEIVEDRGAWQAAIHHIAKRGTPPSDWTMTISSPHPPNSIKATQQPNDPGIRDGLAVEADVEPVCLLRRASPPG